MLLLIKVRKDNVGYNYCGHYGYTGVHGGDIQQRGTRTHTYHKLAQCIGGAPQLASTPQLTQA